MSTLRSYGAYVEDIRSSHRRFETLLYSITLLKIKVPLFQVELLDLTPVVKATFCFGSVNNRKIDQNNIFFKCMTDSELYTLNDNHKST